MSILHDTKLQQVYLPHTMLCRSVQDFASLLQAECHSQEKIFHFAFDSRKVLPGSLFFACPGACVDGHQFLGVAAQNGAVAAVVSEKYQGPDYDLALIPVPDVLMALHTLAQYQFTMGFQSQAKHTIAVTGSVGKTTFKEFLKILLESKGSVYATPGNQNTKLSVPTYLLNQKEPADFVLLEMGMTCAGHIKALAEIANPNIAVVTGIAPAHIQMFPQGELGLAQAKAEIFVPSVSLSFIGPTARRFSCLEENPSPEVVFYGGGDSSLQWKDGYLVYEKEKLLCPLPFSATHLRENFLGAAELALRLGVSLTQIVKKAPRMRPVSYRFEIRIYQKIQFVVDCYNANAYSVKQAFLNLPSPAPGGQVIGILGDMEPGTSKNVYQRLGQEATQCFHRLVCVGEACQALLDSFQLSGKPCVQVSSRKEAASLLDAWAQEGDVVLVKGSNYMKLWEILPWER